MKSLVTRVVSLACLVACGWTAVPLVSAADSQTTAHGTATAVLPAEVQSLLSEVAATYATLEQLQLTGTLTADIDAAGQKQLETRPFTAAYLKPNFFRHELSGEITLGSTGQQLFIYQGKLDRYAATDAPGGPGIMALLPRQMADIIRMQNPSLALALSATGLSDLTTGVTTAALVDDVVIDAAAHKAISLTAEGGQITLVVNPQTKLIRRVVVNLAGPMTAGGVPEVKQALMTVDYTATATDQPQPAAAFAFTPPASARNEGSLAKTDNPAAMAANPKDAAGLVGQPAPDFAIEDLDGKTVKLSELKGSVILLDFWATWCGPCVAALPSIDELHQKHQAAGLKVFAVNVQEAKPKVVKFNTDKKLSLPMLLDAQGEAARGYLVSAIPQTVLIGKDGKVRKVLIGFSSDEKEALSKAIEKALAE
jgi:thiol-disulfide isomerase/thioredoxin